MEKNQMLCFQVVAKTQNISEASRQLFISQPAVSQTILRIEEELGYTLFDRVGKRIILNENGKIMQKAITQMNNIFDDACREMQEYNGRMQQTVSLDIGCASMHLPDLLGSLKKKNPYISYYIYQGQKNTRVDNMIYLLAVRQNKNHMDIPENNLVYEPLFSEQIVLALPQMHRLAQKQELQMQDLFEEDWISLNENWSLGRLVQDTLKAQWTEITPTIVLDNPSLMRELLRKGMGIGFVPEISWKNFGKENLVYKKIMDFNVCRCICIAYRKGKYLTEAEKECIDGIRNYFESMNQSLKVSI